MSGEAYNLLGEAYKFSEGEEESRYINPYNSRKIANSLLLYTFISISLNIPILLYLYSKFSRTFIDLRLYTSP